MPKMDKSAQVDQSGCHMDEALLMFPARPKTAHEDLSSYSQKLTVLEQ